MSLLCLGFAALAPACGDDASDKPDVDCSGPVPAYSQVTVFSTTCTACHSSTKTGVDRMNAPVTVNFDTYAAAMTSSERAVIRVFAGTMPPAGQPVPTENEKQTLYKWGLCNTPQ